MSKITRLLDNLQQRGVVVTAKTALSLAAERYYTMYLNANRNISIHPSATVSIGSSINARNGPVGIGEHCTIHSGAKLMPHDGHISIGSQSSVNPYSILYGHGGLDVGDGVRIAAHCVLIPANHYHDDSDTPIHEQGLRKEGIKVEDDVWIGAGVQVLDGVTIGEGSVIGAGSVVTESIPSYTIAVGTPAEVVDSRE